MSEVCAGSSFEVDGKPIARQGVGKGTWSALLRRGQVPAKVLSLFVGRRQYTG